MIRTTFGKRLAAALSALAVFAVAGCSSAPAMKAEKVWARSSGAAMSNGKHGNSSGGSMPANAAMGSTSAIYMVLSNAGKEVDALVAVKSDVSEKVELHKTTIANDVMRMEPVEKIEVPAGGQAELKKGGLHVMLIGVKKELKAGDKFKAVLVFSKAGEVPIEVEVLDP